MANKYKKQPVYSLSTLKKKEAKKSNPFFELIFVGCLVILSIVPIVLVSESSKASYFQSDDAKAKIAQLIDGSSFSIGDLSQINHKERLWVIKNGSCQHTPLNKLLEGDEVYIYGKRIIYAGNKPARSTPPVQAAYSALNIVRPAGASNQPLINLPNEDYSTIHGVLETLPEFKEFNREIPLFTKNGFQTVKYKDLKVGDKVRFNNQNLIFAGHDHNLFKHSSGIVNKFGEGKFQVPVDFIEKEKVLLLTSEGGKIVTIKDLKNGDSIFFNGQVMTFQGVSKLGDGPDIWSNEEIEQKFDTKSLGPNEVLLKTYDGYKRIDEDSLQKDDIYYKDGKHHQVMGFKKVPKDGFEYKKVTKKWCKDVDSILHITLENGEIIKVTHEHPFATTQMVYVAAKDLVPGTLLFTSKGSPAVVKSIKEIKKKTTVCGITVEDNHNYFVGKSGLLVHNDCFPRGTVKDGNGHAYQVEPGKVIDKATGKELSPYEVFILSSQTDLTSSVHNADLTDIRLSTMQTLSIDEMISVGHILEQKYANSSGLDHWGYLQDRNRLVNLYNDNLQYKYNAMNMTEHQLMEMSGILGNFKADTTEKGKIVLGLLTNAFLLKGSQVGGGGSVIASEINFSPAALKHMEEAGRFVPVNILKEAVKTKGYPDPRGSAGVMHYAQMVRNGKNYNLEVLFDPKTNTIWHFQYSRNAMGPFPKISK
jgi:hypothetical protein